MSRDSWDMSRGEGGPCFSQSGWDENQVTAYHLGGHGGIRPMLDYRSFHGAFRPYLQVGDGFVFTFAIALSYTDPFAVPPERSERCVCTAAAGLP